MQAAKTVAAIHDLSGVGRCALTVAIPVISAMGVQVLPAPTAVYSAHTAFPEFVSQDLTDFLEACLEKWCAMGLKVDCVYTGYLASVRQEEIVRKFMQAQPGALRVVDPVLGDDGRMYRALPEDMPDAMRRLCAHADVITPNLTEAALLTGRPYSEAPMTRAQVEDLLRALRALGTKTALLTGVAIQEDGAKAEAESVRQEMPLGTKICRPGPHVNAWMGEDGRMMLCPYQPVPAGFPGTGDLFASVLTGGLTSGMDMEEAVQLATEYVRDTMRETMQCGTEPLYGVQLERTLEQLTPGGRAEEAMWL